MDNMKYYKGGYEGRVEEGREWIGVIERNGESQKMFFEEGHGREWMEGNGRNVITVLRWYDVYNIRLAVIL